VTSVGEKEEKANTIQPPLLVFFSPSQTILHIQSHPHIHKKNQQRFSRIKNGTQTHPHLLTSSPRYTPKLDRSPLNLPPLLPPQALSHYEKKIFMTPPSSQPPITTPHRHRHPTYSPSPSPFPKHNLTLLLPTIIAPI